MKGKSLAVLVLVVAIALVGASIALAGISTTKHNLGNTANASNTYFATNTDEICVFCHTPHNTGTTVPLWNRTTNAVGFNMYGNTMAGTPSAGAPSTSTLLCFSCHDGVQALDVLNNNPGSTTPTMNNGQNIITGAAALGKDLSNDHPVAIAYYNGRASLRDLTANITTIVRVTAVNTVLGTTASSTVECSSCHEPHSDTNASFLVLSNTGSQLCITCHAK